MALFLSESDVTESALAERLGCSQSYVNQLKNRRKRPGRLMTVKIERITGIPVSSWDPDALTDHVPAAIEALAEAYPLAEGGWLLETLSEPASCDTLEEQITEIARAKIDSLVPIVVACLETDPGRWALIQYAEDIARLALEMPIEDAIASI